jgi:cytochrome c biogenesis factor
MLLARVYKYNLRWAFIMSGLSYSMVVYASYLTRSGVLKDSSAHAFGEEGKAILLVIFTLFFLRVLVFSALNFYSTFSFFFDDNLSQFNLSFFPSR